ncbi:MAG TPA: hypothetical protein VNN20_13115 [Thermodesulfobacteriota bacterium]|nr:hypothetical protein [Thermodesulfobacteriota bacterium]
MIEISINIDVDDPDRAVEFYNKALGLRPGRLSTIAWWEYSELLRRFIYWLSPQAVSLLPALP